MSVLLVVACLVAALCSASLLAEGWARARDREHRPIRRVRDASGGGWTSWRGSVLRVGGEVSEEEILSELDRVELTPLRRSLWWLLAGSELLVGTVWVLGHAGGGAGGFALRVLVGSVGVAASFLCIRQFQLRGEDCTHTRGAHHTCRDD